MVFLHSQFFALRPFATSSWTTQGTPRIPKRRGNWRKFEKIHGSYEPIWAKLPRLAKPIWPRNLPKNATRCRKAAEARRISSKTYFFPRLRREIIIFFRACGAFFCHFSCRNVEQKHKRWTVWEIDFGASPCKFFFFLVFSLVFLLLSRFVVVTCLWVLLSTPSPSILHLPFFRSCFLFHISCPLFLL